ncbi:ATP-dependent DNA helicase [Halopseudomonas salegens]|uniref:Rad3-related DNA helicase n=1 Tax=Halopseudomonas salegens TaxID=1434072 RepID=A0A1H2EUY0_9GAMM|nr:ATP-dependent DNA helicase [Halopseudomonas salegens]SDT98962.1 Rad3-related DNA helicase [Halopseudomonas salegens]
MNYRIGVRELCEFTAKEGDLDLRFTPAPSAQEGMAGHRSVIARRDQHYESEIILSGEYPGLLVSGRADGFDPLRHQLEEIKTHRGDVSRIPQNHRLLHWAQVKVYGWLLCQSRGFDSLDLAVIYFNVVTQQESEFRQCFGADELEAFFLQQCQRFIHMATTEQAHRKARDQSLRSLDFPYPAFRHGQRQLAAQVFRCARDGDTLLAQATTGIGKTLGTLFPQLKALPDQHLDRIFFLTAKTPGRQLALDALEVLQQHPAPPTLRVLEHIARDKACLYPDKACHGESCPLAKGFYDRLPAAREAALSAAWLDQASVRRIAQVHQVCPYYLSQELCRWADLVIADYNYYFDITALLHALTRRNEWRVCLLVDEAHNLINRARSMYTAALDSALLERLQRHGPKKLKRPLERVAAHWRQLHQDQQVDYQIYPQVADLFVVSLQKAVSALTDHLSEQPEGNDPSLLSFYRDALLFCRLAEAYGDHSLFDISRDSGLSGEPQSTLCLRNVVPAPFLAERFATAHSSTLFSATLSPANYYADLLGLPEEYQWLDVDSPFKPEQLCVRIPHKLSTRYADRPASLQPIARLIARQYAEQPGNYLAFFSSYQYLQQVLAAVRNECPGLPVWQQSPGMSEGQRQGFLQHFQPDNRGVGFAVLGGAFGEGIDLPGERLIGVFVATLGLPQINPVNEELKQRTERMFGDGFAYTYLYPGLQKVVQAAGRVIRTPDDKGVLWLLDERFSQPAIQQWLPRWWQLPGPEASRSLAPQLTGNTLHCTPI